MIHCFTTVVRTEGIMTLFAGLGANAIRGVPGAGIQFAAYGFFMRVLLDRE
jgi:hypothetical protein